MSARRQPQRYLPAQPGDPPESLRRRSTSASRGLLCCAFCGTTLCEPERPDPSGRKVPNAYCCRRRAAWASGQRQTQEMTACK